MKMSFDGFGVNGSDEYKSRLATLTPEGKRLNVGPLLAAAPDLLAAIDHVLIASEDGGDMGDINWDLLRDVVAKARTV